MKKAGNGPITIVVDSSTKKPDTSSEESEELVEAPKPARVKVEKPPFESTLEDWLLAGKPDGGIHLLMWQVYARVPFLWKSERIPQPRSVSSYEKSADRYLEFINEHRNSNGGIIVTETAKGGATKTTVATWTIATLAVGTHLPGAIIDTNRGGGKAAGRFDLEDQAITTTNLTNRIANDNGNFTVERLLREGGTDKYTGVMVFHHELGKVLGEANSRKVITLTKQRFHTVMVDTSPNLRDTTAFAASAVSNVRIIVGLGKSDEDLKDIANTLDYPPYGLRRPEVIDTVVIAISGLPLSKCGSRTQYRFAERYGVRPDQVVLIPYDRHLERVGRVQRELLTPPAREAMSKLAYVASETARRHPIAAIQPQLVENFDEVDEADMSQGILN